MNIPNLERAGLEWREWSFLENPAADPALLREDQRAYVTLVLDANDGESKTKTKTVMGASLEEATRRARARGDVGFGRAMEVSAFPNDADIRDAVGDADRNWWWCRRAWGVLRVRIGRGRAGVRRGDGDGLQAESYFCGAGAGRAIVRGWVRRAQGDGNGSGLADAREGATKTPSGIGTNA